MAQGLVENMQAVCGQVEALMTQVMAMPPAEPNFLRDVWAGMPDGNTDFSSYGSLLAQIAFDFIVHHELAHGGLGHEAVIKNASAFEDTPHLDDEAQPEGLDDDADRAAAASAEGGDKSWNQPLEADADLNGLRYTIQYVEHQAKRLQSVQPEDSMGAVWKHLLADDARRWFALMVGVSIGLGCLIAEPRRSLGALSNHSHPPLPARMLVLLHAARQLQPPGLKAGIPDVLLLVTALFAMLRTARGSQTETANSALRAFNVQEGIARFEEIGQHFELLASQMRRLAPRRDLARRFPDFLRWEWYA